MKTQVMTFKISNTFDEWVKYFDSHKEIQVAAGIVPLFRGVHEDDPQTICIVMQIHDDKKAEEFMQKHEAEVVESGHLLETTERNIYL